VLLSSALKGGDFGVGSVERLVPPNGSKIGGIKDFTNLFNA